MAVKQEKYLKRPEDFAYDIQRIGPNDFDQLVPLMQDCFGTSIDIDYFRWKYIQNPEGRFIGYVAIDTFTKNLGGFFGVTSETFEFSGNPRTIYRSCEIMIHPSHRKRGILKKLSGRCFQELKEEGNLFVIGLGNDQTTSQFLKIGWQHLFDYRYYFKPTILCRFSQGSDSVRAEIKLSTAKKAIEEGLDANRIEISSSIRALRTPDQINWRLSNPRYNYLALRLKNDDGSYILFYVDKDKLVIFDLRLTTLESGKKMIAFLSQEVVKKSFTGIVSCSQENGVDAKVLKQLGFLGNSFSFGPYQERIPFLFYTHEDEMENYHSPSDWGITTYDNDSF
ncbi:MAG: GNAT family N-acetyltransferase [Flavobacteriales bacterium]|nr:GNAT family N-acetyltransferase [Flavobacteriales bacterium]